MFQICTVVSGNALCYHLLSVKMKNIQVTTDSLSPREKQEVDASESALPALLRRVSAELRHDSLIPLASIFYYFCSYGTEAPSGLEITSLIRNKCRLSLPVATKYKLFLHKKQQENPKTGRLSVARQQ